MQLGQRQPGFAMVTFDTSWLLMSAVLFVMVWLTRIRLITFHMRRSRGEMYSGHGHLCVGLCVCGSPHSTLLHRPGCDLGEWWGCPLVEHYLAYLQSVHGFRCYDNIAQMRNVRECLYLLCAWFYYRLVRCTMSPLTSGV